MTDLHNEPSHARHSQVSRRHLLWSAGLGAGALASSSMLTGCTASQPRSQASNALAVAMSGDFDTGLDPAVASDLWSININGLVFENLYRISPVSSRKLVPELAREMPQQVTPATYRIPLRKEVTFHDGTVLSAEDVVFSIDRMRDEKTAPLYARFLNIIEEVRAVGDSEIELHLTTPTTLLAERLALVGVVSKAEVASMSGKQLKRKPMGTGPYRATSIVSEQKVLLERFAGYDGPRKFGYERLRMNVVTDSNARMSALRSGQSRLIEKVRPSSFDRLQQADEFETGSVAPGTTTVGMLFHCGKPPLDDKRLRQALLFAIDREAIAKTAFASQARAAWDGIVPKEYEFFNQPRKRYRYDPDQARKLIAEAGYAGRKIPLTFLYGNDSDLVTSQVPIIERNLRDVGFAPDLRPGVTTPHYSQVSAGHYNVLLLLIDPAGISPTTDFVLRWLYYGAVPEQFLYWTNDAAKRVTKLLDTAEAASDLDAHRRVLAEVQAIVNDEVPLGVLHFVNGLSAWHAQLRNYQATASGLAYLEGVRG